MSHTSTIDLEIRDLAALKAACKRLGCELVEGQRTFRDYYGEKPCTHAIKVPGASYTVGILENRGKATFSLLWDSYNRGGLKGVLGEGAGLLKQSYAVEKAKIEARRKGYSCHELVEDGRIKLTMQRRGY